MESAAPSPTLLPGQKKHRKGSCDNCGKRPGTQVWWGEGGSLAFIHGMQQKWCKICVLEAQIPHAEERAAVLPGLRRELKELLAAEAKS